MESFLEYLKKEKIKGVHLFTITEEGRNFFAKMGFNLIFKRKTSYLAYLLNRDIWVLTFAKKIE